MSLLKKMIAKYFPKQPKELEADVYLVSYPKSGRTWLRMLIGKYLQLKYDLDEADILLTYDITQRLDLHTTVMTHAGSGVQTRLHWKSLKYDSSVFDTKRVIFLGRGFKDTFVSSYYQATKRVNVFKGDISSFLRSKRFGIIKILAFHKIWMENAHRPAAFLHVTYEQMHEDTHDVLHRVLAFMGESEVDDSLVDQAVQFCAFSKMQKMEKEKKFNKSIMQPGDSKDITTFKVRKGVVGGYKDELSEVDIQYIDDMTKKFGYN